MSTATSVAAEILHALSMFCDECFFWHQYARGVLDETVQCLEALKTSIPVHLDKEIAECGALFDSIRNTLDILAKEKIFQNVRSQMRQLHEELVRVGDVEVKRMCQTRESRCMMIDILRMKLVKERKTINDISEQVCSELRWQQKDGTITYADQMKYSDMTCRCSCIIEDHLHTTYAHLYVHKMKISNPYQPSLQFYVHMKRPAQLYVQDVMKRKYLALDEHYFPAAKVRKMMQVMQDELKESQNEINCISKDINTMLTKQYRSKEILGMDKTVVDRFVASLKEDCNYAMQYSSEILEVVQRRVENLL